MTKLAKLKGCQICGNEHAADLRPGVLVRPALGELIEKETGRWAEDGWICIADLQKFRNRYVQALLREEKGELSSLEEEVIASLHQQGILASNPEEELQSGLTFGQRLADRLASLAGSWSAIIAFGVVLIVWIAINSLALVMQPFVTPGATYREHFRGLCLPTSKFSSMSALARRRLWLPAQPRTMIIWSSATSRQRFGVPRTIARINNPRNAWLFDEKFSVDVALNQSSVMASLIQEEMSLGDMMTLLKLRRGDYSLVEEKIPPGAYIVGLALKDAGLTENCVIAAIIRDGKVIMPRGSSEFQVGDEILAIADRTGAEQLKTLLTPADTIPS